MVWPVRIALALLLFTAPAGAQDLAAHKDLPSKRDLTAKQDLAANADITPKADFTPKVELPDKPAPRGNFFTRPFYDSKVMILTEINSGAAVWDDLASRRVIDRGGFERNPLMRPFVHTPATLALETVGEVWVVAYLGDRMKRSGHPILRKTWWLPQALNISAKLYGGINSTAILNRTH